MRLIDADELVRNIDELSKDAGFYRPIYDGFKKVINSKQTIDAVPVVRCRECIHRTKHGNCGHPRHEDTLPTAYPNDFCSYGERKEGAD